MPLNLLDIGIGFGVGVIGTAAALSLGVRKIKSEPLRVSPLWGLNDVVEPGSERPRIMAEFIAEGVTVPDGSRILVPRTTIATVPPAVLSRAEVRIHPEVHMNVAIGDAKALVFSGAIRPKTWAASTRDGVVIERLTSEFARLWGEAEPYCEHVTVETAEQFQGRMVEVTGTAGDLVDWHNRKMLRLSDGNGHAVNVLTHDAAAATLQGATVRVTGRVTGDAAHTSIEARTVEVAPEASPKVAVSARR